MQKQSCGFWGNTPLTLVWEFPPGVNLVTEFVYISSRVILLLFGRKPLAFIEDDLLLLGFASLLLWLRYGRDEFSPTPSLYDFVCGLAVFIQLPVFFGIFVG